MRPVQSAPLDTEPAEVANGIAHSLRDAVSKRCRFEQEVYSIHLHNASEIFYILPVAREKPVFKRRSICPLNASVEMLGDRWSLLILRDMMVWGFNTYKQFLASHEGIATNILADRLRRLELCGIISSKPDPSDGRKLIYALTAKGIDLAPVMAEMVLWASRHEKTGNQELIRQLKGNKDQFIAHIRKTWAAKQQAR
jgi:DNA-binding HxlR family transcriptional regulator